MPRADVWRFRSKAVLRALSAYTGQGVSALDIYRAYEVDVSVVEIGYHWLCCRKTSALQKN